MQSGRITAVYEFQESDVRWLYYIKNCEERKDIDELI